MSAAAVRFLSLSERVRVLPITHGSGDFAVRVREEMLARTPDCLAVPLPPSFQEQVEAAVAQLPAVRAVVQRDADAPEGGEEGFSYVPIDPCQGVIAAIRVALGERVPRGIRASTRANPAWAPAFVGSSTMASRNCFSASLVTPCSSSSSPCWT